MKKITIAILLAFLGLCGISMFAFDAYNLDEFILPFIIIFLASLCILLWDILFKEQCKKEIREIVIKENNFPQNLHTIDGIGSRMQGNFLYANGVNVSYCTYVFLNFTIGIKDCYMCTPNNSSYTFHSTIEGRLLEKIYILTFLPSVTICLFSGIFSIAMFFI